MGKVMVGLGAMLVAFVLAMSGWAFDTQKALDGEVAKEPTQLQCGPGHVAGAVVARVVTKKDDVLYTVFFNMKTKLAIIVQHDAEGNPVEIAFGKLVANEDGVHFIVKVQMNADDAIKTFPDPCDYLAPAEA